MPGDVARLMSTSGSHWMIPGSSWVVRDFPSRISLVSGRGVQQACGSCRVLGGVGECSSKSCEASPTRRSVLRGRCPVCPASILARTKMFEYRDDPGELGRTIPRAQQLTCSPEPEAQTQSCALSVHWRTGFECPKFRAHLGRHLWSTLLRSPSDPVTPLALAVFGQHVLSVARWLVVGLGGLARAPRAAITQPSQPYSVPQASEVLRGRRWTPKGPEYPKYSISQHVKHTPRPGPWLRRLVGPHPRGPCRVANPLRTHLAGACSRLHAAGHSVLDTWLALPHSP